MTLEIRKISSFVEETMIEGGRQADRPVTMVVVAAVLKNPWSGQGFVENLRPEILRLAPPLGAEMTRRLVAQMPAERVEAYGKAAAVGVNGEIEHASALIHTLRFGNMFREAVNGTTYLSFTNTRNAPGSLLSLPMTHKTETGKRSHFLTATFQINDAPAPDEILIAIGASDNGRAHPRIADRFQDMAEMEKEKALAWQCLIQNAFAGTQIGPGFPDNIDGAAHEDLPTNIEAIRGFVRACTFSPLASDVFETAICWNMVVVPAKVRAVLVAREIDCDDVLAHSQCRS